MIWEGRNFEFRFPRPALVMGIVNVTPDSFSDGGRYLDRQRAVAHALQLVAEGADLIDIGGESSRPGAVPVEETEELSRVLPVLRELAGRVKVPLSIDTQKPAVARAALEAGATIVNDVAANRSDPEMWRVVGAAGAGYICLHMQGTPQSMQKRPRYDDIVGEINEFFADRLSRLGGFGVRPGQVALDVGIGFGKTLEQNLQLLAQLAHFKRHKRPLVLGLSRKSFLGRLLGIDVDHRLSAGLAGICWALDAGVQVFRVHDVAPSAQAIRVYEAIKKHRCTLSNRSSKI